MPRRITQIFVLVAAVGLLESTASAGVPPPPVNQDLGAPDVAFNDLLEANCRDCHDTALPDRHHANVGTTQPVGTCNYSLETCKDNDDCTFDGRCAGNTYGPACATDPECVVVDVDSCDAGLCRDGVTVCVDDTECPTVDQGPCIGRDYCVGESEAPYDTGSPTAYDCLDCHNMTWDGSAWAMESFRDCRVCHNTEGQPLHPTRGEGPNQHHRTANAEAGDCQACHGSFVDLGYANAVQPVPWIPPYDPSIVTPWPNDKPNAGPNGEGTCNFCHAPGTTPEAGFTILDNHDTHHDTGLTHGIYPDDPGACVALLCRDGVTACVEDADCPPLVDGCYACHDTDFVEGGHDFSAVSIRTCEVCHGINSLHNIAVDSDADGEITPGAEPAWYSHIGSNDDCTGCHGFTPAARSATPFFLAAIPVVDSVDCTPVDAFTDSCTAYGDNFIDTNSPFGTLVALLATVNDDGSLNVDYDSVTTMTSVTGLVVKGDELTLNNLLVVKLDPNGNMLVQSELRSYLNAPVVAVTDATCRKGTSTIVGGEFGSYVEVPEGGPEGPTATNLLCEIVKKKKGKGKKKKVTIYEYAAISSWSGTEIVAESSTCPKRCTVETVWGSAEFGVGKGKKKKKKK